MSRICQLDAIVVNKIAAGEVIERPASVIKELLENSVDALATRIQVDVADGGTELIRVVDDGQGVHPDDLLLAVTSHATSKIRSDEDLFSVCTMGFRGEALASIASVSRFRIRTRQADATECTQLEVNCGQTGTPTLTGGPTGTLVEVRQLFANTPVRRKFLKTTATEFGHISEQFSRVAIANPRLHMVLRHNDKLVYELPATDRLIDRLRLFHGAELADNLIPVESETVVGADTSRVIRLWGYVAHPSQSKSTRKGQHLFLNGRWIQDRSLQHALSEAYRGLLMVGRNPIAFLFLEMPADLVDVNVHPTKSEVRFQDSQQLYRQLLSTLRTKFLSSDLDGTFAVSRRDQTINAETPGTPATAAPRPELQRDLDTWAANALEPWKPAQRTDSSSTIHSPSTLPATSPPSAPRTIPQLPQLPPTAAAAGGGFTGVEVAVPSPSESGLSAAASGGSLATDDRPARSPVNSSGIDVADNMAFAQTHVNNVATEFADESVDADQSIEAAIVEQLANTFGVSAQHNNESARPVPTAIHETDSFRAFQIHDCYIVVAADEGLTVIDQHALHERILYERFRERVLNDGVETQQLLVPLSLEFSSREATLLIEHCDVLLELGFGVEEFGGNTILLTRHPVMLGRANLARIVRDIAEQLEQSDQRVTRRDLLDSLLHMMACRAAIKAGHRLAPEEMQALLEQRHLIDDAHHCPHGRPTALVLSRGTLDKQFGRLG